MSCWLHYEAQLLEYMKLLAFWNWNPINIFLFFDSWRNSINTRRWKSTRGFHLNSINFSSFRLSWPPSILFCCACGKCAHFWTVLLWLYAVIIKSLASKQNTLFIEKWSNAIIDNCLKFLYFVIFETWQKTLKIFLIVRYASNIYSRDLSSYTLKYVKEKQKIQRFSYLQVT